MSEELRGQVRDLAHNDAGLPAAYVSSAAAALETWCKRGSWDLCRQCASVQPRHLKEAASRDAAKGNIILCKNCAKKEDKKTWMPSPEDVPAVLRGLSWAQIEALRPLDVDSGPEWKAEFGYYFHSSMIRFSWALDDVEDKIDALPSRQERKRAKKVRATSLLGPRSVYGSLSDRWSRPTRFDVFGLDWRRLSISSWTRTTATTGNGSSGTGAS